jgi:4-aminobutyrate--pyruvate transaminase
VPDTLQERPNSVEARDVAYHLHPYTNAEAHLEQGPLVMETGRGIHVTDTSGKTYIEAMAGLWSVGVGFDERRLVEAATRQMQRLPYYHSFAHRTHEPAVDLAEALIAMAPVPMSKVHFTNSGSEANDTALKLIWYRSNAMGRPEKKKVISRIRGYHGVTIASASLTGLPYNHRSFDLPIAGVLHTSCPHYWREGRDGETEEAFATRMADDLEALIQREGPETIAAFFAEPVMGAGGVVVPPATYWEKIQAVLRRHDVLLVADEVICGFGRTGNMWGSQTYGIEPDMMVMSKQLTSSYFPLSALMMNERTFTPIMEESGRIGTLGHGFTGAAHPVGAAIALENLAIIRERDLVGNAARVGAHLQARLREAFADHPLVGEVRGVGLIAAVELLEDGKPGARGAKMAKHLMEEGLLCRAMTDAMAFCPPMIITEGEVDEIVARFGRGLDRLSRDAA